MSPKGEWPMAEEEIEGHRRYCDLHCSEVFLHKSAAIMALWALVGIGITLLGSSVTWAFTTTSQLSKMEVILKSQGDEIQSLRATYKSIENKLDVILNTSTETNQTIKGFTK